MCLQTVPMKLNLKFSTIARINSLSIIPRFPSLMAPYLLGSVKIKAVLSSCDMNVFLCLPLQMRWLILLQQRAWVTLESPRYLLHTLR